MFKVYPDTSNDQFNIPIAPRKVLASDIIRPGADGRSIRQVQGSDISTSDILISNDVYNVSGVGSLPDDEEHTVEAAADVPANVNRIGEGSDYVTLTHFIGYRLKVYRNNIPMVNLATDENGFTWNIKTGKFTPYVKPIKEEVFTFQATLKIPDPATYLVQASGENKNNIIVDNDITFLTIFVNNRIRVTRNNILQSFVSDFTWDNETAKLTLNVKPAIDEEFYVEAY